MKTVNKQKLCMLLAGMIVGIFLGWLFSRGKPSATITETVETYYDTIPYYAPKPQSELALGTSVYTLPTTCFLGGGSGGEPRRQSSDSIIVAQDTIRVPMYGTGAGGEPRCSSDSAVVELPIIQRHYADSTYEAWVSGPLDPKLDSLRIFRPTTIITRQEVINSKQKHWHLGVQAGYGYGVKGFQPYIGLGLTYSIISF
jgi:hypothetical protein